jgi:hypothetical protein
MAPRRPHLNILRKRDVDANQQVPTASGIGGAMTVNPLATAAAPAGGLNFDSTAILNNVPPQSAIPLADTGLTVTFTPSPTPSTDPSTSDPAAASASDSSASTSNDISMSTVVGACVGALAGAIILITIGYCIYKRSAPKRAAAARGPRAPMSATRNAHGEDARMRSKSENWDKLGEGADAASGEADTWESKFPEETKEIDSFSVHTEKLSMGGAKAAPRAPSIKTVATHKSESAPVFDLGPHPFGQYTPNMELKIEEPQPPAPSYLGNVEIGGGPTISWGDGDTVTGSFLSLQGRMSGSVSAMAEFARPTPNVTYHSVVPHRWESAEVEHMDEGSHSNNPFADDANHENHKSGATNPFFGGGGPIRSVKSSAPKPSLKGKERQLTPPPPTEPSRNPFDDVLAQNPETFEPEPIPVIIKHTQTHSQEPSVSSNSERAMQTLIAALDLTPEEVQERLRVASMQPSIISNTYSIYTAETEEVTGAFPLPPSSS